MNAQKFPAGWNQERVSQLIAELDSRSDEEWAAADEAAATEGEHQTVVTVPSRLMPEIRRLLAAHQVADASGL